MEAKIFRTVSPVPVDTEEYIEHHGILGMHWGIRRYQPYSVRGRKGGKGGKEIGEAKKASKRITRKEAKAAKRQADMEAEKKRLKKEAQQAKKDREQKKQAAIKTGSAKEIYPYVKDLTDDELRSVLNRIDNEKRLAKYSQEEINAGRVTVEDVMDRVGKTTKYINTGIDAYNTIAKLNNTFNGKQMATINGVHKSKQKEEKKDKHEQRLLLEDKKRKRG